MISGTFIERPRLAAVVSIVITLAGILAIFNLPVTQYPNISPPTVQVSASYPGADSTVLADTVGAPLERAINGVEGMIYMSSSSSNQGTYSLTITFAIGTDPDIAQVNVSNRVQLATPQLPTSVVDQGVTVRTQSPNFLLAVAFPIDADSSLSIIDAASYVSTNLTTAVQRINGVGNAQVLGPSNYAMRVWTDPDKLTQFGLSPTDVADAIRSQNLAAALGQIGGAPAVDGQAVVYTVTAQGRLSDPDAFGDIVVRAGDQGGLVRLRDVAEIELGSEDYSTNSFLGDRPSLTMQVNQSPGANAINTVGLIRDELEQRAGEFPEGLSYEVVYDTTEYVRVTIEEIVKTLLLTAGIIVLVVFTFLQGVRATIIPLIAIPVSLVGTFAALLAIGFSINVITLLALILAIGIVVDDAILVVENARRVMEENPDMERREAVTKAMGEITGPIISTTLVLLAVFLPTAFLPGLTGQLYRQFGLSLSISIMLSSIVALTLTPALCGAMLQRANSKLWVFRQFNKLLEKSRDGYGRVVGFFVRRGILAIAALAGAIALAWISYANLSGELVPAEDQGAILIDVSLPDGASLQRTTETMREIGDLVQNTDGVENVIQVAGFSFLGGSRSSVGIAIATLAPWGERRDLFAILGQLNGQFATIPGAQITAFPPPSIPGTGSVGGFSMEILATQGQEPAEVAQVARSFISAANQRPEIGNARTTFSADVPRIFVDVDRERSEQLGLSVASIYDTLGQTLGAGFVNQFLYEGRVYQVRLQADERFRTEPSDITGLYVQNRANESVPLSSVAELRTEFGPYILPRFNLFTSASISGSPAGDSSSGAALTALEEVAQETLPEGYDYQFSGTSYQQQQAGNLTIIAFALAFVFAYLFLVGQFESWLQPLAIMLSVLVGAAGATTTLLLAGLTANVYAQIGIVMLIGLAAKNAILIVEFAKNRHAEGMPITEAAIMGAQQRFRAVMMTALAFVFGLLPLVLASGAGAAARNAIGTAALGGMLAATLLGIMIIPALYAILERAGEGRRGVFWGRERHEEKKEQTA
ncbi:HAE1 family hydrophobic/amphiphilic exporter-1/multidrug efflux pump [Palleronia aestuarii]|uniref:Efflux pump membrane transporter n=1 Tax=Palleronia aestuarii TaxID=568105 RepID=A0A2W7NHU1_9RHOB|nr:efflux RND transporter permease subunit [Palleronia aestuarii]PZX17797.1 HAE1 family hydrophobic/amphiphilic exporter-1/multidrug efflux pump [Palleronia aestuarii]